MDDGETLLSVETSSDEELGSSGGECGSKDMLGTETWPSAERQRECATSLSWDAACVWEKTCLIVPADEPGSKSPGGKRDESGACSEVPLLSWESASE